MIKVFVDGSQGTTGLRIHEYLNKMNHIKVLNIEDIKRKVLEERLRKIDETDLTFLCLPDEASREIVKFIPKESLVIDTSTAHRVNDDWIYGLPELNGSQREKIRKSKRVANPGCHSTGLILLIKPLVESGIIDKDTFLSATSITGYSGGGKNMIREYEKKENIKEVISPQLYGLGQNHKHLPEVMAITKIKTTPGFTPIIGDYYNGMVVTIVLEKSMVREKINMQKFYEDYYGLEPLIEVVKDSSALSQISGSGMANKNGVKIFICGNEERITLVAQYDNLGKGAAGAAIQNMNIMLGIDERTGL